MTQLFDQDTIKKLQATCASCGVTNNAYVDEKDWMSYTAGAFVQVVWPDKSIDEREVCIANRPGNIFAKLGYWCQECSDKAAEEE